MAEKVGHFWHNIEVNRLTFDTNESIAKDVEQIQLAQIQALFESSVIEKRGHSPLQPFPRQEYYISLSHCML